MIRVCGLFAMLISMSARADDVELARQHFEAGRLHFDRGDYQGALAEFKAAGRISPRPELSFNIARAYERMGDAARAVAFYREYLHGLPGASDRTEVEEALARLYRRVGDVKVVTHAAEAKVSLDGEALEPRADATWPATEGPHVLSVACAGCVTQKATVEVVAGRTVETTVEPLTPAAPTKRRWKLWVGVGAAAAAVLAGGVTLGVVLSRHTTDYWLDAAKTCQAPCNLVDYR